MTSVATQITSMQNDTVANNLTTQRRNPSSKTDDKSMFLNLMMQQLKNQDPTEPTSNTEWLAQLAQYSSLEQMTDMNTGISECMKYMSAIYNDLGMNSEINQTLSMIGKEVTIKDPDDKSGTTKITGKVTEASFEDGTGKVKVNDKYYSIANIISVKGNG